MKLRRIILLCVVLLLSAQRVHAKNAQWQISTTFPYWLGRTDVITIAPSYVNNGMNTLHTVIVQGGTE